jgi:hypothetical protein
VSTTAPSEFVVWRSTYKKIKRLETAGVLGPEQCPEPNYWHWPVREPEHLPEEFKQMFADYGEIRLY